MASGLGVPAGGLEGKKIQGKEGDETESDFQEPCRQLCAHYSRGCSFVSPCCGKVYPCRLCHNDSEAHEINRFSVTEIVCRRCSAKQPVAGLCRGCGMNFGRYFCSICRLFDDNTSKGQFHCEKCGLCRVGGQEQFFHCDECGLCLALSVRGSHTCRKEASKDNCPVCMEDIHSSRVAAHVPKCGHLIHDTCYKQMLQNGLYQCPLCYQSLVDMNGTWQTMDREREEWMMPQHLRNFVVKIQCRDCHQESETNFHVIGLKCPKCSSYNTVRCGNEEIPEDGGVGALGEDHGDNDRDMVMRILNNLLRLRAGLRRNGDASESSDSDEDVDEQVNDDGGSHEGVAAIAAQSEEEEEGGQNQRGSGANSSASLPSLENEDGSYDGDHSDESESESESSASEEEEDGGGEAAAGFVQSFPFLVSQVINNIFGGHDSSGDEEEEEEEGDWPQHHHSDWSDSDSTSSLVPNLLPDQSEDGWVTEEEEVIIGGVETEEAAASNSGTVCMLDDAQVRPDRNGVHSSAVADSQDWETASEEVTVGGDADSMGRDVVSEITSSI